MQNKYATLDKVDGMMTNIQMSFTEFKLQVEDFEFNRKQFMYDLEVLKNTFTEYVSQSDLKKNIEQLHFKFEQYAPWESVRGIYKEFVGYVQQKELQDYKDVVKDLFA